MVKTSVNVPILRSNYDTIFIFLRTLENILRNHINADITKTIKP
jgi:hypothetical protein